MGIAIRLVIDYLRSQQTRSQKISQYFKRHLQSTESTISLNGNLTIGDTLPSPTDDTTFKLALQDILSAIEALDERSKWVLRLKTIFYNPFGKNEIQALADYLQLPRQVVDEKVQTLMNQLVQVAEIKEMELSKAEGLEIEMEVLIKRLLEYKRSGGAELETIAVYEEDIRAKAEGMLRLAKSGKQRIEPSAEQIASILEWAPEQINNVNVIICRARKKLRASDAFQTYLQSQLEKPPKQSGNRR